MKSNDLNKAGALVVFSGGQDSTTCLAWALDRYEQVETVGFDYGQVHSIEMSVRHTIRDQMAALRPAWRGLGSGRLGGAADRGRGRRGDRGAAQGGGAEGLDRKSTSLN